MRIVFSWDDGAPQDEKVFELHNKYKIPGMFFVPTSNREGIDVISPKMIRAAESKYVHFGCHTHNHTYLTDIPVGEVENEVLENKKYLEEILGHEIDHFCLPGGKYNRDILEIVSKYFRTIRSADTMNFHRNIDGLISPTFHFFPRGKISLLGNSCRHKSYRQLFKMLGIISSDYFFIIKSLVKWSKGTDDDVIIWGHSWEIDKFGLWGELDSFMKFIRCECPENIVSYEELMK